MNQITMKLQADHLILEALKEDISSEDVTTNSVMKEAVAGEVDLICMELLPDWKCSRECLPFWIRTRRQSYTAKTEKK